MPDATSDDEGVRLTWAEVCERYPGEWVSMDRADWVDEDFSAFRTAVHLRHSADYEKSFPDPPAPGDPPNDDVLIHQFTGPIRPARPLYLR